MKEEIVTKIFIIPKKLLLQSKKEFFSFNMFIHQTNNSVCLVEISVISSLHKITHIVKQNKKNKKDSKN